MYTLASAIVTDSLCQVWVGGRGSILHFVMTGCRQQIMSNGPEPMVTTKGFDNDDHNHDDQLGEIYPTMLNELNCTFGVSFSRFHCCGRHDHGFWPS